MRFIVFFGYTAEAKKAMVANPGDRAAAISALASSAGGSIESVEFMFGSWDGFVIMNVPDSTTAAAISLAVGSTGSFAALETRQLLSPQEFGTARRAAAGLSYTPPGG